METHELQLLSMPLKMIPVSMLLPNAEIYTLCSPPIHTSLFFIVAALLLGNNF